MSRAALAKIETDEAPYTTHVRVRLVSWRAWLVPIPLRRVQLQEPLAVGAYILIDDRCLSEEE